MEHEYYTSPDHDDRRTWVPIAVVVTLLAALLGGLFVAFRDEGPAEVEGTLPSLVAPVMTVATTTPTPTTGPVVITPPPVIVAPDVTSDPDEPDTGATAPGDETSANSREALRQLADDAGATVVTDVVAMGSGRFAMLVRSGDAELYRWSGSAWERETVLGTPSSVRTIDVADVTGDGIDDFIVSLVGLARPGGVFSRATFSFELLPFNLTSGQVDWVDDLHVNLGRLLSNVPDNGATSQVDWTWTGRQFEVLG
jgi:hypothetical protein